MMRNSSAYKKYHLGLILDFNRERRITYLVNYKQLEIEVRTEYVLPILLKKNIYLSKDWKTEIRKHKTSWKSKILNDNKWNRVYGINKKN